MKKFPFLIIAIVFFTTTNIQSQTLLNAVEIRYLNIEFEGVSATDEMNDGRMLIPYNSTKMMLYQDEELTYWVEFKYRKCGKKAKLERKTFVETKDGELINGSKTKIKLSIEEDKSAWFVASTRDTIEIKSNNDHTFIAGFDYDMRVSN